MIEFVGAVLETVRRALALDADLFTWVQQRSDAWGVCVAVAVLAGASTLLGHSVVLFINRVRGVRFAVSLLVSGVAVGLLFAIEALLIWLVGFAVTPDGPSLGAVTRAVMLASSPLVFGFFVLVPYLGPLFARLLSVWSLVMLWRIVMLVYGLGLVPGLLVTASAWLVVLLLSQVITRPLTGVTNLLWRLVTGHDKVFSGEDVLAGFPVGLPSPPSKRSRRAVEGDATC